jgi:ribosomal-protein-alanine N-acetyltransferase
LPPDGTLLVRARVRLRPLDEPDAPAVLALYSDPETMRYLARPRMSELAHADELIAKSREGYADGRLLQLALERTADGAFLGLALLFNFNKGSARAEIGYALATAHRSQGYMIEALAALIDHAFGALALNRLEADIDPRNIASARLLERLGFAPEGVLRERWIVAGEPSDSRMYGLLARDWRAGR